MTTSTTYIYCLSASYYWIDCQLFWYGLGDDDQSGWIRELI